MRPAVLAAALFLAMSPAFASGGAEPSSSSPLGGADTTVELPMLVAPVSVNGRLYHYAYMRIQLKATNAAAVERARAKIPYIIDSLLRDVHRQSIALNGDPRQIDGEALKTRLLAAANAAVGDGTFASLTFRDTIQTDNPELNQAAAAEAETAAPSPEPAKTASAH